MEVTQCLTQGRVPWATIVHQEYRLSNPVHLELLTTLLEEKALPTVWNVRLGPTARATVSPHPLASVMLDTSAQEDKTAPPRQTWHAAQGTSVSKVAGMRLVARQESTSHTGDNLTVILVLQALTVKLLETMRYLMLPTSQQQEIILVVIVATEVLKCLLTAQLVPTAQLGQCMRPTTCVHLVPTAMSQDCQMIHSVHLVNQDHTALVKET